MSGEWILNDLKGSPHRIRPETHWFTETTKKVRDDGALWFSLRLTRRRAEELYKWDLKRDFRRTHRRRRTDDADRPHGIEVRTGRAKVGHDWHRHPRSRESVRRSGSAACGAGSKSAMSGSRLRAKVRSGRTPNIFRRLLRKPRNQPPAQFRRAVPSLSRPSMMESVSRTIASAWGRPRHASDIFLIWR